MIMESSEFNWKEFS